MFRKCKPVAPQLRPPPNVGGIDMVALGSDFDGIGDNLKFKDYAGLPQLVDAIEKEFGAAACDKICHGNALRLFKEVIG